MTTQTVTTRDLSRLWLDPDFRAEFSATTLAAFPSNPAGDADAYEPLLPQAAEDTYSLTCGSYTAYSYCSCTTFCSPGSTSVCAC